MLLFFLFYFSFLSFQQTWLRCLRTIPQAFDGLGMTKASKSLPDLAHKMDSPRQESSNSLCIKFPTHNSIKNGSIQWPWWRTMFVPQWAKAFSVPLQTSCIFAWLCSDLSNLDIKEWRQWFSKTCSFTSSASPAPSGHGLEPKYTRQTVLNYQLDC